MPPARRKKKVYTTADALFAPAELPPPPGPPKPDPDNYDFSSARDCVAAFAALFDKKWPVEAVDARVLELREDLKGIGWAKDKVDGFVNRAILESGWGFEGLDKKVKEKPATSPTVAEEPPVTIDISGMIPQPRPGYRSGTGKF